MQLFPHNDLQLLPRFPLQKFYTTMSELKSEVEYVIKTGRQIVDKKQVDFPDKLSKQLDALKQQYNVIGSQVSDGENTSKNLKIRIWLLTFFCSFTLILLALFNIIVIIFCVDYQTFFFFPSVLRVWRM